MGIRLNLLSTASRIRRADTKGKGWESVLSLRSGYVWDSHRTKHYWRVADGLKPEFKWLTENFSAWLKITLQTPKKINRVVVHAYYSIARVRYGLGDALIQVWDASPFGVAECCARERWIHFLSHARQTQKWSV